MTTFFDCPSCGKHIAEKNRKAKVLCWIALNKDSPYFPQPAGKCPECGEDYDTNNYTPRKEVKSVKAKSKTKSSKQAKAEVKDQDTDSVVGDVNGDGQVDEEDLSIVHKAYAKAKKKLKK